LSCTNGTLSCSVGNVYPNCQYQACAAVNGACDLPWGGIIDNGQNVTAYQAATETWNAGGTCVNSETRTCNAGTLSGSYTFQSCTVNAAATCTQPWGGTLNGSAPGNTASAYSTSSVTPPATCPAANTLTCTNGTLTCTNGTVASSCEYSSCTAGLLSGTRFDGAAASDNFGWNVVTGSINGAGYADLVISAPFASLGAASSGSVYVVFGSASGFADPLALSTLNGTNGFRLDGGSANDHMGNAVAIADINND